MKSLEINPFDSESESRYEAFRQMRALGPIHKLPEGQLFVVQQAAVEQGLKSVNHFVGSFGEFGETAEEDTIMAGIPEPRHGKIRKLFNSALAYNHASLVEPYVRRYSAERLEESLEVVAREGEVEIMGHYARRIPSAVIAEVLGIPDDRIDDFARWSDEVLERQGQSDRVNEPIANLHPEFSAYLDQQIMARVLDENPPNDVMTRLLEAELDGERLSRRAVLTQTIFLIIAGNETTRNLIGNLLYRLAADPDLYSQLREDRSLVGALVEESLRIDAPVQLLARTCTEDIEIGGTKIRRGDRVLYSIASANRDESAYPDPDRFRLDRARPRDHVGFGAGPHICPGAFLARMEAQLAVETLLDRVSKMELAPGYRFDPNPVFWALGPRSLRVTLTPA